jgi:hypothetical protein
MKTEQHSFHVQSAVPPTVEIDTQAASVYVRFRKSAVARTVSQNAKLAHIAIDLDSKNQVVGIEAVGVREFNLAFLLRQARVDAPRVDMAKARYISAGLTTAGGAPD